MQFPIIIGLRRSLLLVLAPIGIHAAALVAVLLPEWPPAVRTAALCLLLASGVRSAILSRLPVTALRLLPDGRIECRLKGEEAFSSAELLPLATVHPLLTVLHLLAGDQRRTVVLVPDSGCAEELRLLRIWLRWRADFNAGADPEE